MTCVSTCTSGSFVRDVSNIRIFVKDLNLALIKLHLHNGKDKGLFIDLQQNTCVMLQRYWIRNSPRASTIGWLDLADYIMRHDIFKVKRSKKQNIDF